MVRIILIILAAILSIISLLLLAITITMVIEESGHTMGNEAFGYFSTALILTIIFSIPTAIIWTYIYRKNKSKQLSTNKTK
jgi:membrane protein implicated in regulation of membrane protease activity